MSLGDGQTGLHSRDGLAVLVEHHMRRADRSGRPVSIVFVRLDNLAPPSSERGDEADHLVVETALVLKQATRASDVLARVGRDQFCVLLADAAEGSEEIVLTRLVEAIAGHNAGRVHVAPLALSVGTATYSPEHPTSLDDLIANAEAQMPRRGDGA